MFPFHYCDAIMGTVASQITSLTIVYTTVYSDTDQSKNQSSASLAFVWGIHRGPVNSPHKWPVTRKMFPFDDVIMWWRHHGYIISNNLPSTMFNCLDCYSKYYNWFLLLLQYLFDDDEISSLYRFRIMIYLSHWGRDKMASIFANDMLLSMFLNENFWISNKISLKYVP